MQQWKLSHFGTLQHTQIYPFPLYNAQMIAKYKNEEENRLYIYAPCKTSRMRHVALTMHTYVSIA